MIPARHYNRLEREIARVDNGKAARCPETHLGVSETRCSRELDHVGCHVAFLPTYVMQWSKYKRLPSCYPAKARRGAA